MGTSVPPPERRPGVLMGTSVRRPEGALRGASLKPFERRAEAVCVLRGDDPVLLSPSPPPPPDFSGCTPSRESGEEDVVELTPGLLGCEMGRYFGSSVIHDIRCERW